MTPHEILARGLAEVPQPRSSFEAAERAFAVAVGHRLFTVMAFRTDPPRAERVHTSNPGAYPVTGSKPVPDNAWTEQVLVGRRPFLASSIEAIAEVFPDHELIASLGCGSVINVPVVHAGVVLGTVNLLDAAGRYDPSHLALCSELAQYLVASLRRD